MSKQRTGPREERNLAHPETLHEPSLLLLLRIVALIDEVEGGGRGRVHRGTAARLRMVCYKTLHNCSTVVPSLSASMASPSSGENTGSRSAFLSPATRPAHPLSRIAQEQCGANSLLDSSHSRGPTD
jgi:hypothetical protein